MVTTFVWLRFLANSWTNYPLHFHELTEKSSARAIQRRKTLERCPHCYFFITTTFVKTIDFYAKALFGKQLMRKGVFCQKKILFNNKKRLYSIKTPTFGTMRFPIYQINAFSKQSFGGNPAF